MKPKSPTTSRTRPELEPAQHNVTNTSEAPWYLPKKPVNPAQASQVHVLANAGVARLVRVCYTEGPEGSFVTARASTAKTRAGNVVTRIYVGACADIGGTDIELTNPNDTAAAGTYALLP